VSDCKFFKLLVFEKDFMHAKILFLLFRVVKKVLILNPIAVYSSKVFFLLGWSAVLRGTSDVDKRACQMVCILFYFDHIWVFDLLMSSSRDIPIPLLNQPITRIGTSDNRELKQTRRWRKRERHLKMWPRVSAIIFQLFKLIMLEKCVLTILELN